MHLSQGSEGPLLTALDVQHLLHIDRSTVYRMAEDGRIPSIRVGRTWRFPADRIHAMLAGTGAQADPALTPDEVPQAPATGPRTATSPPHATPDPELDRDVARAAVEIAAELLGVMMVVTDMHGHPLTAVANPCAWFADHAEDPAMLEACITEWRDLADHPDMTPVFQQGALGFQCARAFIRHGTTLVGMVLAGGVSPTSDGASDPDLYHLDDTERARVLGALPRIAAAISTPTVRPDAAPTTEPQTAAAPKEN